MEMLAITLAVLAVAGASVTWTLGRSRKILDEWARTNNLRIDAAEFRWFWRGPYFLRTTENQSVYYVTVTDSSGRTRTGWVRCGSFWLGVLGNKASVKWEEPETNSSA